MYLATTKPPYHFPAAVRVYKKKAGGLRGEISIPSSLQGLEISPIEGGYHRDAEEGCRK